MRPCLPHEGVGGGWVTKLVWTARLPLHVIPKGTAPALATSVPLSPCRSYAQRPTNNTQHNRCVLNGTSVLVIVTLLTFV